MEPAQQPPYEEHYQRERQHGVRVVRSELIGELLGGSFLMLSVLDKPDDLLQ